MHQTRKCVIIQVTASYHFGDVPKWLKGPHSKCGRRLNNAREFESLHLRQLTASDISLAVSLFHYRSPSYVRSATLLCSKNNLKGGFCATPQLRLAASSLGSTERKELADPVDQTTHSHLIALPAGRPARSFPLGKFRYSRVYSR